MAWGVGLSTFRSFEGCFGLNDKNDTMTKLDWILIERSPLDRTLEIMESWFTTVVIAPDNLGERFGFLPVQYFLFLELSHIFHGVAKFEKNGHGVFPS